VIRPWATVKPAGSFIQEFAATTDSAPPIPVTATGTRLQK
jgi:hypothetical protein